VKAVAIVDGEHYPDVVRDALAELPYEFVGVMLVGGTEKLRGAPDYGVPMVSEPGDAEIAVDLSDEPVLGPAERMRWASRALAAGLPYVGADFRFDPPSYAPFPLPSLAVIGTGKRVGKTAVSGHVARLLARDREVVVVAMGRGGPATPEVADVRPTADSLLELSRSGRHAASDYLEIAALAGVVTVGCRRAGGGLAGRVFESNVLEGARIAAELRPDLVIFDGSGAAIPPVEVDRRILVARTDREAAKHKGLTYFLMDMAQDAVQVRPLRQITGEAEFNELFIEEARIPHENIIGGTGTAAYTGCGGQAGKTGTTDGYTDAWTLEVDGEDAWSADLEHAAPLPRVGERIQFIGEDGSRRDHRDDDHRRLPGEEAENK